MTSYENGFGHNYESNHKYQIEVATKYEDLLEAKALDDLAFGQHQGISMRELEEIMRNGAVVLLRDQEGRLVGESQVITAPTTDHPELHPEEAYDYGTAVHPAFQNHGIAQMLFKAQEIIAMEAGKTKNTLTVRLENAQSLRGRFKAGYRITGYNPNKYGPVEQDGARLIMERVHDHIEDVYGSDTLVKKLEDGEIHLVDHHEIDHDRVEDRTYVGIVIKTGDQVDFDGHSVISRIIGTKYFKGIGLLKPEEIGSSEGKSLLVFKNTKASGL